MPTLRETVIDRPRFWLAETVAGDIIRQRVDVAVREAYVARQEDLGWRSLSARVTDNTLTPLNHQIAVQTSRYLYRYNPLAKAIIEIPVDYILGEGLTITATAEDDATRARVQVVIDSFWNDRTNQMDLRLHKGLIRLLRDGEWIAPVFVNEFNGAVKIGTLDPLRLKEVKANPENYEEVQSLVFQAQQPGAPDITKAVIREDKETGLLGGECFYFVTNDAGDGDRGWPELTCMLDWADIYDDGLQNAMRQVRFLSAFVWDVTMKGATPSQIAARLTEILANPPRPGSVNVHNDAETWQAVTSNVAAQAPKDQLRDVKLHIATGARVPESWLANGDAANRATAVAQADPSYKYLARRQRHFRFLIETMVQFALDQARPHTLRGLSDRDLRFTVNLPDMIADDNKVAADTLVALTQALRVACDSSWLSQATARRAFWNVLPTIGTEVDPAKEEEVLQAEERDSQDQQFMPPEVAPELPLAPLPVPMARNGNGARP